MIKWLSCLLLVYNGYSFTFTNNIGASFGQDSVAVYVTSNSDCSLAGTSKEEILNYLGPAIEDFWNTVNTSRLTITVGGIYQTDDSNFLTGTLCNPDLDSTCTSNYVPQVNEIVIACNNNTSDNFTSTGIYALTLSNKFEGTTIAGSVILINNAAGSAFNGLSADQKIAVISHEIGHAIGLGHSQFPKNLMYYTTVPKRNALGQDDVDGVSFLYPVKGDGCGLIGSVSDQNTKNNHFIIYLLMGILLSFFVIFFQKLIFKR
jgi:hypothetical protein